MSTAFEIQSVRVSRPDAQCRKSFVKVTSIAEYSASDTRYLHLTHLSPHIVIRRVSSHFSPEASCAKVSRGRFARRVDGFISQYIGRPHAAARLTCHVAHLRGLDPARGFGPGRGLAAGFGLGGIVILSYATLSACIASFATGWSHLSGCRRSASRR